MKENDHRINCTAIVITLSCRKYRNGIHADDSRDGSTRQENRRRGRLGRAKSSGATAVYLQHGNRLDLFLQLPHPFQRGRHLLPDVLENTRTIVQCLFFAFMSRGYLSMLMLYKSFSVLRIMRCKMEIDRNYRVSSLHKSELCFLIQSSRMLASFEYGIS